MITLRRASERKHLELHKQETWFSFFASDPRGSFTDRFESLEMLNEDRVPPGASGTRLSTNNTEVVTYVREGALAYENSLGHSGVIHAGEFHRMAPQVRHREGNASHDEWAHSFQIGLRAANTSPGQEQKRFSAAERRGALCVVASPDARNGSLRIHDDARIYSSILHTGQHIAHELSRGRCAWLHLVQGEVSFHDTVLTAGDGAGITHERAVSVTAREESELLLVELCHESRTTKGSTP